MTMRIEVTVTYHETTGDLTISKPEITYNRGDWVEWTFDKIPPDSFGYLRFDNAPALGPFHTLRSLAERSLVGKGNTRAGGDIRYTYTAMLLSRKEPGVLAVSADASVLQKKAEPDTTPDVTVTYREGQTLQVEPSPVGLNLGDTAIWHFRGFPTGYFATLQFVDSQGEVLPHPFADFYVTAPLPDQPAGTFWANGIGFRTKIVEESPERYAVKVLDLPATLTYHVQVRDSEGRIVSTDDPLIDNLGPPIPG
jgi:hypothetical protein